MVKSMQIKGNPKDLMRDLREPKFLNRSGIQMEHPLLLLPKQTYMSQVNLKQI